VADQGRGRDALIEFALQRLDAAAMAVSASQATVVEKHAILGEVAGAYSVVCVLGRRQPGPGRSDR